MMRGTRKALPLAILAALAISVVVVATGQAENAETGKFTAAEFPSVGTGHEEGSVNHFTITADKITFSCKSVTYEGTLAAKSTELTVTPHYTECTDSGSAVVHFDLNGCDFLFTSATYTKATETTHGSAHVKCPAGKQITVTVTNPISPGQVICTIHIKEQSPKGTVTYINKAAGGVTPKNWITAEANLEKIHYVETEDSAFFCPFQHNFTGEDGKFTSNVTIKGFKDLGKHASLTTPGTETYKEGEEQNIHVKP